MAGPVGEEVVTAGGPKAGKAEGGEETDGGAVCGGSGKVEDMRDAT